MRSARGQATVEYVGAVLLLAIVLAAAAVAVAAPELPRAVVAKLRLALCIVGADVCTSAEAAARGLEPCLIAGEEHERDKGISFLIFRAGGADFWSVERRSDGTIVLSEGYGQSFEGTAGFGVQLGPVQEGGSASGGGAFRSGRSWVVSEAKLRYVLSQTKGNPTNARLTLPLLLGEPASTYLEGGGTGSATLASQATEDIPGGAAGANARAVLGRRKDPAGTTYYLDLGAAGNGQLTSQAAGVDLSGRVTAEYRASDPPVITLRSRAGEETETVLRLSLGDPEDRAAARRVAFLALSDPALALRDLLARIRARGTVERLRYRIHKDSSGSTYDVGLGVKLGYDHAESALTRELVDAEVLNGPLPARREDCLQPAASFASGHR